jgi:hypothetical protein
MQLPEFLLLQNQRLASALHTFRNLQAGHAPHSEAWAAYQARIEQAEASHQARQTLITAIATARQAAANYRAQPNAEGYAELRRHFDQLLVRQTVPLAATYLPRHRAVPGGPLPCGSCGQRLCATLERCLTREVDPDQPQPAGRPAATAG